MTATKIAVEILAIHDPRVMPVTKQDFDSSKVMFCTCGHIDCICRTKRNHKKDCKFRKAIQCPIGIECDHGYGVCPICDPCTCDASN